jgi:phosphotriesterase-related protein
VLRLLGAGAGCAAAAKLGWLDGWLEDASAALPVQSVGGAAVLQVPRGGIIRTILADIDPNRISGATLMHEHLGSGRPGVRRGGGPPLPVDNPTQDAAWMTEELNLAKRAGLGCIVATGAGLPGPDNATYLRLLSERTGVHVVAAAAYYMKQTYPPGLATQSEDEIADGLAQGARVGRLGAFGELGVGNDQADLDPLEMKVFRAHAKAQQRTGLPIFTHTNYSTGPNVSMDMAVRQLDVLEAAGGNPRSIAIGHVCCLDDPMVEIAKRVARRGAFIAFDRVTRQQQWVPDAKRIVMLKAMLDAGLTGSMLLSSDYIGRVNTAVGEVNGYPGPLHAREGGPGYARPLVLFVPLMRKAGISDDVIRRITVDNPRRFLTFVPKQA